LGKGDIIVSRYSVPPLEVIVVLLAADPMYLPVHDYTVPVRVEERYGIHDRFILYAGMLKPNKNLP